MIRAKRNATYLFLCLYSNTYRRFLKQPVAGLLLPCGVLHWSQQLVHHHLANYFSRNKEGDIFILFKLQTISLALRFEGDSCEFYVCNYCDV